MTATIEDVLAGRARWTVEEGDCQQVIPSLPAHSIDCVITSPPYAMQRKKQYGGIPEAEYPAWTVGWMDGLKNALKPQGSVLINIREHIKDGQISDYVLRTRLALRESGWVECEELIWVKPSAPPVGSLERPRRSWERILWFSLTGKPWVDVRANGKPSSHIGLNNTSRNINTWATPSSNFSEGIARVKDYAEIDIHGNAITNHPAAYPVALADWMLSLVCPPGGVALDPFSGSGTTGIAALKTGRFFIGIEKESSYVTLSRERLHTEEQKARQLEFAA